jgi:hypothetical protein
MTERDVPMRTAEEPAQRFGLLLIALAAILVGYPHFENSRAGAFLGGVTSLLVLIGAVYAVRTSRWTQSLASIEGIIGVLYVAVLIARIVGIYARRRSGEQSGLCLPKTGPDPNH